MTKCLRIVDILCNTSLLSMMLSYFLIPFINQIYSTVVIKVKDTKLDSRIKILSKLS